MGKFEPLAFKGVRFAWTEPQLMGIVNLTPDSFSDGGDYFEKDRAIQHGWDQYRAGATIIDLGAESTRPGATMVSAEEELHRLLPVIEALVELPIPLSVDTYKAEVARRVLKAGAAIINDVTGLGAEPELGKAVAEAGAVLVIGH